MPTVAEAASVSQTQMSGAQAAGLSVLSEGDVLTFTLYRRVVLPLDGFVFWVRADQLSPGGPYNAVGYNWSPYNGPTHIDVQAETLDVTPASLHHTTLNQQDEAESFSVQKFSLTCKEPVDQLNAVAPDQLWVGGRDGLRLAFSSRTGFYKTANTYHYTGDALYPSLATQLVDYPEQLDLGSVVVSNSLPIWLALSQRFPVYPSFLIPDNIKPPYAAIHIGDDDTDALQAAPFYDGTTGSRWQLAKDRVRVTFYGVRNDSVMDWLDQVQQYTLANPTVMGLMNSPVPRDAKRGQTEFSILAQKKVVTFEVSYYQTSIRNVAWQLIRQVFINFSPGPGLPMTNIGPLPPGVPPPPPEQDGSLVFDQPSNSGWLSALWGT